MILQPNSKNPSANLPLPENSGSTLIGNQTPTSPEPIRERIIAHATEFKFVYNRYTTPVTIEFGSSDSESTVNISVKHPKLFAAIKILEPLATINSRDKIINHPGELPMVTEYTEFFTVTTDKKPRFPRFFVQHEITSKFTISALKYGDHNIMTTLQPLRV